MYPAPTSAPMSSDLARTWNGVERRRVPRSRFDAPLDLLYSTLRLIARHVHGFWGAILAFLVLAFVIGVIGSVFFGVLAEAVRGGLTQRLDEQVLRWLAARRGPELDVAMLEITTVGSGLPLILMVAVAVVFLGATKHHWSAAFLLLASLGGTTLNRILKWYFDRERPSVVDWLHFTDSPSFPSGHAMSSFIVFSSLAYLVARIAPTRGLKRFTWVFALAMILAVGVSRMYLGVHYPSDVLGGFIAAFAWVLFIAGAMVALRYFAVRRPDTYAEERDLEATSAPADTP